MKSISTFSTSKDTNNSTFLNLWLIIPVLILIIVLSVIMPGPTSSTDRKRYRDNLLSTIINDNSFSDFQTDLFRYEISSDSVTAAYTLHDTDTYNIPELTPILTDFSSKNYSKDSENGISKQTISGLLQKLSSFKNNNMNTDDKITCDLLYKHLQLSNTFCDYSYYETLLGKTTGAASALPVTLSEYPLNDSDDIDEYLSLLKQIPSYFDSVMDYENSKSLKGMETPVFILKDTKNELSRFIMGLRNDDNCFSEPFNDRLRSISSLSQEERNKYISTNKYYINQYVIPSYEKLYEYITERIDLSNDIADKHGSDKQGSDINITDKHANVSSGHPNIGSISGNTVVETLQNSQSKNKDELPEENTSYGLCTLPDGKEYYSLIVKEATGSYRPVTELIKMTENALNNALSDVLYIATTDTDAYMYYCDHPVETGYSSPEGILEALSLMIRKDYPLLDTAPSYKIKTVPDTLAEMVSPAFYMIPAIDDYENNTIYINPLYTCEENGNLFTTLAHEGFPGHLYQTVYFNSTNPNPVRQILNYPGYVEGWATYVELNSFSFINYPKYAESLPTLYRSDAIINLALSSRIDMGVNYEGWTLADTCSYFEELGFNSYYASDIYSYVVEAPGNYLSYFIGYLEIDNLKQQYKNLMMENYSEYEFHKAFLDIGPGDFETIRKYMLHN